MAYRRKHKPGLFDDYFFILALGFICALIFVDLIWKIILVLFLLFVSGFYIHAYKRKIKFFRDLGIDEIDHMDGPTFERKLWLLFKDLGYSVEATPIRGDWGADLVLSKNGQRTVVQAKRYSKPVGLSAVQEVVAARAKYNCTYSIVITNSTYTAQARELARHNGTELWDRDKLLNELARIHGKD